MNNEQVQREVSERQLYLDFGNNEQDNANQDEKACGDQK